MKFFVEPIREQDHCLSDIIEAVEFYANIYTHPLIRRQPLGLRNDMPDVAFADNEYIESETKRREEGSLRMRSLAMKLRAKHKND